MRYYIGSCPHNPRAILKGLVKCGRPAWDRPQSDDWKTAGRFRGDQIFELLDRFRVCDGAQFGQVAVTSASSRLTANR
jgi:hypothetical protein